MYTSYIGKKFLKLYNEREGKNLSSKEFFNTVQFPIFFDSDKHLMHVHGSTFFQKVNKKDFALNQSEADYRLERLHKDIMNEKVSGSTFVGYAAEDSNSVTSGQVSSIDMQISTEEIYLSWIGEGLSIGVSGGLLLIDKEDILWWIFQGWNKYRTFLNQTPNLKSRQVETWNGQWLNYYSEKSKANNVIVDIPIGERKGEGMEGEIAISSLAWSRLIFILARKYPKENLIGYAYLFSKTNSTFGFINIALPIIRRMYELRDAIFIDEKKSILSDKEIETLSTFYNFKTACQFGTIGLRALEPTKLRDYMPKGSMLYAKGNDFKFTNEESYHNYQLYKIWITAMLNKTELLNLASQVGSSLITLEKSDDRGKKVYSTLSQEIRDSKNIRFFIENLSRVLEHTTDNADIFKNVVEETLKMPSDNFPLFITLIRFEYNYQKTKN